MDGLFAGWPFPLAVTVLTLIAFARAGATHLLGRAVAAGTQRTRARDLMNSPGFDRARQAINRWGPPVVSLSFLTVGVQTLIHLASGVTRMPARRYLPALLVGALLWGLFYATVGFVTLGAWLTLYHHSPLGAVALLVAAGIGIAGFVVGQLRRGRAARVRDDAPERTPTGV